MAINSYTNKKHLLQAKPVNSFVRVAFVTCRDSIKSSCCNSKENLFILYEKRVHVKLKTPHNTSNKFVVFLGTQEQSLVAKHSYGYPKEKHIFFQQKMYASI
jgi:hypothetical protein